MLRIALSSLRVRLILLVLMAVIPALGLMVYSAMEQRHSAAEEIKTNALRLSQLTAADVERFVEGARQMLISLAETQVVRNQDSQACNRRFAALRKQYQHYLNIAATDAAGNFFASGIPLSRPLNSADLPWFQRAVKTRNFALGDFQVGRITGKPSINCSYPVFDHKGRLSAVLMAAVDLTWLNQIAQEANLPAGATLTVVDRHGTIISRYPDPGQWIGKVLPEANLVKTILTQKEGLEEASGIDGVKRLYCFTPIHGAVDTGLYLSIGISKDMAFKKVNRTLYRNLAVLGLVAALALATAWVAGNRLILRQVKTLVGAIIQLRNGDLSARTGLPHQDGEISQLARAFDEMAEALEQREADHQWAEARIRQLNRLLRTISEINQLIVRENDRERILSETCRVLVEHGEFKMAWIGMADFKTGKVLPVAHAGWGKNYLGEIQVRCDDTPQGCGPTGTAIRENKTKICNDLENDPSFAPWREAARKYGYRASAALPLRAGKTVIGALNLYATNANAFGKEEENLLEELAGDIAYALKNFDEVEAHRQAEEEMRRLNRELSVLYTIDRAVAQTLKLEEILHSALKSTLEVLKLEAGCLYLLEAGGETMSIQAHSGYSEDFIRQVKYIKLGEGISGRAAAERKPVVISITDYPTPRLLPYLVKEKLQTIISTPLISGGQLLGALNMSSRRPRAFPPEEIELLAAIGSQLGGAVQNARLYEAAQQELTERERTEEQLRESEKRYKHLLETTTDYIYTVKIENRRAVSTSHSPGCIAVTGYNAEEYDVDPLLWLRMVYEEDQPLVTEQNARIMAGEWAAPIEHRIIHKNGSLRWVRNTPVRRFDEQKQLIAYDGLISDITEHKQAEEEIRLKAQLLDNANDSIFLHDFEGNFFYFNETAYKSRGYIKDELMAKNLRDLVTPRYEDHFALRVQELKEKGKISFESEHLCRDGTVMPIEVNARMLETGGKKLILSIIRDITERRQAEEVLRRYTERFSKAFRASPVAIAITTMEEGRFLDINDNWMRLTGYAREEVIGRTIDDLGILPPPQDRRTIFQQLSREKSIQEKELTVRTKSGEIREGLGSFELIELSGETCSLNMFHDLTERKRLEAQLLQSQKIEAVGTLAGGVAHDFNNMLTAMMGNLELAKFKIDDAPSVKTHLEEIENIVSRAALLTQQLLAFSRRQILQPIPLNLNETITNTSKMLSRLIGEHIELELQLEAKLGTVKADPTQLEQVIINLCVNARDAMSKGGKLILKTQNIHLGENYIINHPWVKAGDYVLLEIIDTGVGMDHTTMERIFEPFFTTKEVGKGTGLGLSMVYGIVKQHKGYIDVYSEPDRGTIFKIYLPVVEEKLIEKEIKETPKKVEGGKETILLAEDEEPLREAIRNILEIFGYTVLTAQDGQEAVEVYEKQKGRIDLVILDAVMPKMGGKEVAKWIYQLNRRQKILFTSGYSAEGLHESFTIPENMHFIQKPYNAKTLAQKVREVLES